MNKFKIDDIVCIKNMTDEEILKIEEKNWESHLESWFLYVKENIGKKCKILHVVNLEFSEQGRKSLSVMFEYQSPNPYLSNYVLPETLFKHFSKEIKVFEDE